jgi:hypothetical protein
MRYSVLTLLGLLLFTLLLPAKDKKEDKPQSSVSFTVLKDDSGKPVRNAAVILHPIGESGKQSPGGFELKTDNDGKTSFDGVPYGTLRVQVIAHGFQTFGDDFAIVQPEQEITVRLKRPQQQYSIYDKKGDSTEGKNP